MNVVDSPVLWPVFFGAGVAAGFVDAVAGGGGLVTVPVLLGAGYPPAEALATNKLQATFGSGAAAWYYGRAGLVRLREAWRGILCTAVGAAAGVLAVKVTDPEVLRRMIPFLLLGVAWVVWKRPSLGDQARPARWNLRLFQVVAGLALGFYDGFFGPGTGTFWVLAIMAVLGFEWLRATAWTKAMNFTSNVVALGAFALTTRIDVVAGLLMGAGQWIGARLGARVAMRGGSRVIRPVFLVMVCLAAGRLLYDAWWPAR